MMIVKSISTCTSVTLFGNCVGVCVFGAPIESAAILGANVHNGAPNGRPNCKIFAICKSLPQNLNLQAMKQLNNGSLTTKFKLASNEAIKLVHTRSSRLRAGSVLGRNEAYYKQRR
jgi:hypothetical protein